MVKKKFFCKKNFFFSEKTPPRGLLREKTKKNWDVSFGDYTFETHRNIDFGNT
jgi:hypothetical protein